ncbi:DNA replication checkpoint protein CHL12/CTF18 [Klebsormidium nitens]|uniref:Chromosome transmission fidelity protein 18 homolog n=1 Tax=Klebsormidium nitens TaxID=105231 RepID=A0A1Y1I8B2_KLENI|nr:DNA replication checkpoint protein CHL12/CTF18 [Klebsormidium nitens]|eukprot:GAQ84926.1 DNA replication checkpoint protein CHL12/CTF18 [Klebsormidium nitens]
MEEPDFDELEWMAQGEFPDEEDFEPPEDLDEFEEVVDTSKKRAADGQPESKPPVVLNGLPKKPRTEEPPGPSQTGAPKARAWSPPRPTFDEPAPDEVPSTSGRQERAWSPPRPPSGRGDGAWSPPRPPPAEDTGSPSTSARPTSPPPAKKLSRIAAEIEGDCMPITGPTGERVYAQLDGGGGSRVTSARQLRELFKAPGDKSEGLGGKPLLGEPIEKLMERIEQERLEQAIKDSEVLAQKLQAASETDVEMSDGPQEEMLWVDKYAPRAFTELLSDEQTNREVLRWIKEWDPCVFHRPSRPPTSFVAHAPVASYRGGFTARGGRNSTGLQPGGRGGDRPDWKHLKEAKFQGRGRGFGEQQNGGRGGGRGFGEQQNGGRGGGRGFGDALQAPVFKKPSDGRPEQKVLLLCGAPGLGKTTLAHVAAHHCGYRVVEVNASDDRSANSLKQRILDAVQMQPVMGDRRPNCLVIDEIDGALNGAEGKGAIDALLAIVNAGASGSRDSDKDADEAGGNHLAPSKKKKKKGAVKKLSRPVICICNDMYAPALRQLRQVAKVFVFAPPAPSRLATRLKFICTKEGYSADTRALTALCEHTECDVRACLNTLQFLHRRGKALRLADISSQVVGRKDMTHNVFEIWTELFQRKKSKAGTGTALSGSPAMQGTMTRNAEQQEFHRIQNLLSGYGEHDFVMEGVHENFLRMRYHEGTLQKTVECLEWMGDSELMSRRVHSRQHFFLMAYQPATLQAVRRLIANPERPHIEFPKTYNKFRADHSSQRQLLQSWQMEMDPGVARGLNPSAIIRDLVSPLLDIVAPPTLRPVASQLLSEKEKGEVSELVDTMIGYGFTYKLQTGFGVNPGAGPQLDPALGRLAAFEGRPFQHRELTVTLREMLAHEVSLQIIRKEGAARAARAAAVNPSKLGDVSGSPADVTRSRPAKSPAKAEPGASKNGGLNGRAEAPPRKAENGKLEKKVVKAAAKVYVNYFERFKKPALKRNGVEEEAVPVQSVTNIRDAMPVLYKFHEGFTNAVRRPVLVKDLLG